MNKKHAFLMVACCLIPLAALVAVNVFQIPLKSVFLFAMVLFCPLSHILMMKYMVHDVGHDESRASSPHGGHADMHHEHSDGTDPSLSS